MQPATGLAPPRPHQTRLKVHYSCLLVALATAHLEPIDWR